MPLSDLLLFIRYEAAGEYLLIEVLKICDVLAKRTAPRVQRFKASIFNLKFDQNKFLIKTSFRIL